MIFTLPTLSVSGPLVPVIDSLAPSIVTVTAWVSVPSALATVKLSVNVSPALRPWIVDWPFDAA